MIKNDVYYELFASKTVPNPDQVGYWIDLGANSKGKVIKLYNQDTEKWVKLTDATSEDAVAPFIGSNGNWWVDDRDTGVPAAGKNPYIGENNHWYIFDPLENEYVDTGIFAKGLSAYELAVKHGFNGTEEEWIASLSKASEDAAVIALAAADKANMAADRCDIATENAERATEEAHEAADRSNEIANNPPKIVNEEWYMYDENTKQYIPTGVKAIGDAFSIKKEYPSVQAMEDDYDNPDILVGQFVIINTGDVELPDDAKLYLKSIEGWKFIVDMSGARGIRGYSAYEVAVHNGFNGTEKEWVDSLSQDSKDAAAEALKAKEQVEETERQVKAAEAARVEEELKRVAQESARVSAENTRIANENARKDAESKRVTAENSRVDAENIRVTNENSRKTAETGRVNAEDARVSAEAARVSAENNRANQEASRVASESARVTNENNRKTAETARVNQENTRQSNETTRQTNETTRQNNERAREAAETKRQEDTAKAIADTNIAKTEAEAATVNANTQANRAKDYADHQPKIVARQWWVWDETIKDYKNTGIYATGEAGKSPIIKDSYWWVYDNAIGDYVTTNIAVSPFIIVLTQDSGTDEWSAQPGSYNTADAAIKSNSNLIFNLRRRRGFDGNEYFTPTHYYRWNPGEGSAIKFILQDSDEYSAWHEEEIRVSLYSYPVDAVNVEIVRKVVDNLTSTSASESLSANQGKVLDEKKIDKTTIPNVITSLGPVNSRPQEVTISVIKTDTSSGSLSDGAITLPTASTTSAGVMPGAAYDKLMGIQAGAERNVQADWTVTDTSSDAYIKNKPNLATVATSGSYNDLSNKPTISSLSGIPLSQKGVANGVASLDSNGTVPASQLPSYVDDVIEYPNRAAFPATGESGKVYIAADTNITYRWSGTTYVVIGSDLALGETSSTAYPGDKGKKNADDIADLNIAVVQINADLTTKYSTTVQNDGKYLKLTGGNMTNRIHFRTDTELNRYIDFITTNDTYLGSFGINDTGLDVNNSRSGKQFQLKNDGAILYGGKKVWYEGNDGTGSGLDADMVDGLQASAFARRDASKDQDLNGLTGSGILSNTLDSSATPERHYPMQQAGALFYGEGPYSKTLQIYGTYRDNRWFARGGGNQETNYTAWKEFAFLDSNGKVAKAVTADSATSATNADTVDNFHAIGPATNNLIRRCTVGTETSGLSSYWVKFASVSIPEANGDRDLVLYVANVYSANSIATGILKAHVRIGSLGTAPMVTKLDWVVNNGIPVDIFKLYYDNNGNFELWCNLSYTGASGQYNSFQFAVISDGTRVNNQGTYWKLYNTKFSTVQTPTLPSSINSTLLTIKNPTSQATSLLTARTLWGQSFNGTANVSGNMTGVGSITSSGEITTSSLIKATSSSSASGGFFRIGHPGAAWNTGLGAYNVDINTNTSQTPLVLAYRKGTTDYAGANRLFAAELLNDGSILKFAFAGAEKMSFGKAGDIYAAGKVTATTFVGALQGNATTATTATTANAVAWNNVTSKPTWIGTTKPTYTAAEVGALAANGTATAATKLATARTIWGNSFDGTGNVTGVLNSTSNIQTTGQVITNGGGDAFSAFFVSNISGKAWMEGIGAYNLSLKNNGEQVPILMAYRENTDFNVKANRLFEFDILNSGGSARFYFKGIDENKFEFVENGKFICKYLAGELDYSYVKNVTTHSNEFNVVDEGYTDGSNQLLWFNYRRLSGSGKIPIIAFGTADGTGSYATLRCNGVDAQSTIITAGYITTTGNWFQVDKSGCGLYHSTHNIRLMGTSGGWQLESAVHCPGGFWKDSDVRLKSNIKPLNHTLEQILAIPTCSFDMDGKNQIGTIAQEIEKDFPYLISEGIRNKNTVDPNYDWEVVKIPEGDKEVDYVKVKNVAYEQMSILNLEAIKLLNEKIEKLTSRVTELETKLSKYE